MNHFALILYIVCCVLDTATILISGLLYKKYRHKAFNYLAILMFGAMLSMLVEAVRAYGRISAADIGVFEHLFYLIFEPAGEIISFIMLPVVAFAAVGKEFPGRLNLTSKVYALIVVCTFPVEAVTGSSYINLSRELAGHFVFHIAAYLIILRYYSSVDNFNLKRALKSYLLLGAVIVPLSLFFQAEVTAGFIRMDHPEIPFPYIIYCISFNILCILNTFKFLFAPAVPGEREISGEFLHRYHITGREREIIELLLKGYTNKLIAKTLFISAKTVKNHIYSIYRKTGVKSRIQLANCILPRGDLTGPSGN